MKAIKAYFLSRLTREKYTVSTLILVGAAAWAIVFLGQFRDFWSQYSRNSATLRRQDAVIRSAPQIDERAIKAASVLEPTRTFNRTSLNGALTTMAQQTGLRFSIADGGSTPGDQFTLHAVTMTISGATDWAAIANFYLRLNAAAPYINLQDFQITTTTGNNPAHNLTLKIVSVERPRS